MATKTTNYNLVKPSYDENADIAVINGNMNIIDTKMKEIDDKTNNNSVEWNQLVNSGTKIAEITVGENKKDVYAPAGGGATITVDAELSTESENPVQNKVITAELNGLKSDLDELDSQLSESINEISNGLVNLDFEIESTGFINDNLSIISTNEWNITKPIKVLKGAEYYFKSINYTVVSAITECDELGTNLINTIRLGLFIDDNTPTIVSFVPEKDMFVKLSYRNDYVPSFRSFTKIDWLANKVRITEEISNDNNVIINDNLSFNIGKNRFDVNKSVDGFISSDGKTITLYEDWKTSDYIYVHDMKQIFVSADYLGSPNPLRMFFFTIYDENKNVIYRFDDMDSPYSIIDRVYYIRFSYHANVTNIQLEDGNAPSVYESYYRFPILGDKKWKGKKWCVIGDSLTQHNERTRFNYHDYVAMDTGISVLNYGSSGKGYKAGGDEDAFYHIASLIPTDCDVVTIFGSGNDLSYGYDLGNINDTGTETICGCINTTIDTLIQRMPKIYLGIISPTPWENYPPSDRENAMALYCKALEEICKNRSIPFLDLYHCSNLRPWTLEGRMACYSNDDGGGVHPDEYGHKLIAPRFKAFLETII